MSTNSNFDTLARAWLDEGPTQLSDFALDAALEEVHLTRQRRATRVPWRFPTMPAISRATGIAAVALVAVVGAGGLIYLRSNDPGAGSQGTPAPTAASTTAPTAAPLPSGIPGWTSYTSAVYGFTMAYPSDWHVLERASQEWSAQLAAIDSFPYADIFVSPGATGAEEIGLQVWQMPAPAAIYALSDGALFAKLCETIVREECGSAGSLFAPRERYVGPLGLLPTFDDQGARLPKPQGYLRTLISFADEQPFAFVIDDESKVVTVFWVPREDDFPEAVKYGGTEALLMAIVGQLKVE